MAEFAAVAETSTKRTFQNLDLFLTVVFTVELMVNWAAEWCFRFFYTWHSGFNKWNCFDFIGEPS